MLKMLVVKIIAVIKRIPIAESGGYAGGYQYGVRRRKQINHNGVGLGARGPKNGWGSKGGPGY
ncbi:hypothetical protein [Caballeronia mineralivorans]|jgi:hypothetical protein|uniref:hypothetical protein n=1 Tax=Caballeronia mineralivorans TaxID=2010198 RepID=UPI002AFE831D|nr:hypothetical protein [Caballeronia mineralivorans]MDB5781473.1 hypothetical protein [Caballeronia mineralivorans]MEA3103010.1 hypothetical protein [Caballeronia mineralivorans]